MRFIGSGPMRFYVKILFWMYGYHISAGNPRIWAKKKMTSCSLLVKWHKALMTLLLNVNICTLRSTPTHTARCMSSCTTVLREKFLSARASSEQLAPFLLLLKTASSMDWRKAESESKVKHLTVVLQCVIQLENRSALPHLPAHFTLHISRALTELEALQGLKTPGWLAGPYFWSGVSQYSYVFILSSPYIASVKRMSFLISKIASGPFETG